MARTDPATRDDVCGPLGTPGGVAPALNSATDEQVDRALETAALSVWPPRWRSLTRDAHAYLAAHILASTPGVDLGGGEEGDTIGPLTSEADGPASRSYGQIGGADSVPGSDADLMRTFYGRQFLRLRRHQRGFGSVVVTGGRFPA